MSLARISPFTEPWYFPSFDHPFSPEDPALRNGTCKENKRSREIILTKTKHNE